MKLTPEEKSKEKLPVGNGKKRSPKPPVTCFT